MEKNDEFLTTRDVLSIGLFSSSRLYRMLSDGTFPAPIKIGKRSYWHKSDVELWKNGVRSRLSADAMRKHVEKIVRGRNLIDL